MPYSIILLLLPVIAFSHRTTTQLIGLNVDGIYVISFGVTDNTGVSARTVVNMIVNNSLPPTITLTAPANGTSYVQGSAINLTCSATDADGSVSKVDYYQGATLIGTSTTAPFSFTWNGAATGTYNITAIATDNSGATTISSAAQITVAARSLSGEDGWSLAGNAGIISSTQFLGTTDAQPLIFKTNGAERMRLTATGNLMAGYQPDNGYKFQVNGNASVSGYGVFGGVGIGAVEGTYEAGGIGISSGSIYGPLKLGGSNQGWTTSMVEIGCGYPGALKDLFNLVDQNAILRVKGGWGYVNTDNLSASTLAVEPVINVTAGNGTTIRGIYYNPTLTALNNGIHIAFQNTLGNNIFNSTSGNTLIGSTTDNGSKLQVNGNLSTTGLVMTTGAAAGKVLTSDANGNASWQASGSSGNNWPASGTNIYNANTGLVILGPLPNNLPTDDANLKLLVNGDIYAHKLKITQNSWADYVFALGYQLKPLKEVASFIQKNKHLPGIPSGTDVVKNGVDVGENQVMLLKKIEELTLYLIKDHEEIEELKKSNALLLQKKIAFGKKRKYHN